jgi:hypothetical protein
MFKATWTVVVNSSWLSWVGDDSDRAEVMRKWLADNCAGRFHITLASASAGKINAVSFISEGDALLFYLAHS